MRPEDIKTVVFWHTFNTDKEFRKHFEKKIFNSIYLKCSPCCEVRFEVESIDDLSLKELEILNIRGQHFLDFCVQSALNDLTHTRYDETKFGEYLANYIEAKSSYDFFQKEVSEILELFN